MAPDAPARAAGCGRPFADLPSAQAAITAWMHAYNHARPHQALDMATPAGLFRPGASLEREPAAAARGRRPHSWEVSSEEFA